MPAKKLIVIGGGAAGFFCAVNAARMDPGLQVILLEKSGKLLSKVKVSGGGRCNVTHACFNIPDMSRKYPRGGNFVKKSFHGFFTTDTIQWFADRGVKLKEEADGRMFPVTDSSQTIIDCLMREAQRYKVEIQLHQEVKQVIRDGEAWQVCTADGMIRSAAHLCIACGGYPKAGMFDWLKALGHTIHEPLPSLFTFNIPGHPITQLMGISVDDVRVRIPALKLEQQGPVLITHWGLSGPAVLRLSAWGARELAQSMYEFTVLLNWLPGYSEQTLKEEFQRIRFGSAAQKVVNRNGLGLPQRLWEYFLQQAGINKDLRWADLPSREQHKLINIICAGQFIVKGKTTFKEEFVTAGGIHLSEIDPNTMMSRKWPSLYFAGEIMDVDGITGGFNFQHAWTSAFLAAKSIAN